MQAEYFKQIILSLSNDMRVIMIKMADRLHNMRTLEHMSRDKQLKIASETLMLYAPFAYRMGLYNIKQNWKTCRSNILNPNFTIIFTSSLKIPNLIVQSSSCSL